MVGICSFVRYEMPSTPDVEPDGGIVEHESEEIITAVGNREESTDDQRSYTSDSQDRRRSNNLWDHELNSRVSYPHFLCKVLILDFQQLKPCSCKKVFSCIMLIFTAQ